MPSKALVKKLKRIAREFKVSVRFERGPKFYGGYYSGDKKSIVVVTQTSDNWFVSAFFHELCHVLGHREGIYKSYYRKRMALRHRRFLALRAERHTDNRAQKICKEYFPKIRFKYGYRNKLQVAWLREWYSGYEY